MKVLLQDIKTGLYLQGVSGWTTDPNAALDFETTSRAFQFWRDNDLLDVRLVLRYKGGQYETVLDVLPERARPSVTQQLSR